MIHSYHQDSNRADPSSGPSYQSLSVVSDMIHQADAGKYQVLSSLCNFAENCFHAQTTKFKSHVWLLAQMPPRILSALCVSSPQLEARWEWTGRESRCPQVHHTPSKCWRLLTRFCFMTLKAKPTWCSEFPRLWNKPLCTGSLVPSKLHPRKKLTWKSETFWYTKSKHNLGWLQSWRISGETMVYHRPSPDRRGHKHFRWKSWPRKGTTWTSKCFSENFPKFHVTIW